MFSQLNYLTERKNMTDLLIENGRMLTSAGWSEIGYLAIQDGKISVMGTGPAPDDLHQSANQVISAEGMAVLPGLTNAHTHLSQTFMRGLSAGRPLLRWLKELIWPLQEAMSLEELRLAALLGLVENLRCGATHVVDHQKITKTPDYSLAVCSAAEQIGLRLTLARAWSDKGSNAESPESILAEIESLFERYHDHTRIQIASGPLTPWRATAYTLQKTHALALRYGGATHIHVSETRDEVQMTLDETGLRPVAWLDALGLLGPECQIVHAVWVDEQEIRLLKERQARVVHCPVSNAVLGSGMAPVYEMQQAGVPILLGTDGPASNDNQDCFENMKMALSVAHLRNLVPTQLLPGEVVRMATAGKTLSVGKIGDVILVNLRNVRATPVQDIDSALVLCCQGSDVDTVIVDGKVLMHQKQILVVDEKTLLKECEQSVVGLRMRAGLNC
jgi:5-methylthioadenosine/S-adenosylhomocysteine deaminase